jgi:hypothetical protein
MHFANTDNILKSRNKYSLAGIFLPVLKFEPRTLYIAMQALYFLASSPAFLVDFCYFLGRVTYFCLGASPQTEIFLSVVSCVYGITYMYSKTQLINWDGGLNFFPGLALNCDHPTLHLLKSWDYRHESPYPVCLLSF